jgi:hypothetical protein
MDGPRHGGRLRHSDLGTDFTLCLLGPSTGKPIAALTLPGTTTFCDHGTCWRPVERLRRHSNGLVLGKMRLKLLAGTTGTGKLVLTNKGASPHLGINVFYPYALPVMARLKRGDGGTCWEATYSVALKNSSDMGFVAFAD